MKCVGTQQLNIVVLIQCPTALILKNDCLSFVLLCLTTNKLETRTSHTPNFRCVAKVGNPRHLKMHRLFCDFFEGGTVLVEEPAALLVCHVFFYNLDLNM